MCFTITIWPQPNKLEALPLAGRQGARGSAGVAERTWLSDQDIIDMFYVAGSTATSLQLSQERNPISCACGGLREMPPSPPPPTCKRIPRSRVSRRGSFKIQLLNYALWAVVCSWLAGQPTVQVSSARAWPKEIKSRRRLGEQKFESGQKENAATEKRATRRKIIIANLCQSSS